MLDVDQLTELLERGMRDVTHLRDDELATLLHELASPTQRDAAIAVMTGHREDAGRLAHSIAPATPWFTQGPLDSDAIRHALPLLHRLADESAGGHVATTVDSILAYIDWASGRPLRAAARLGRHVDDDALGPLLQRILAAGIPGPRITSSANRPRR